MTPTTGRLTGKFGVGLMVWGGGLVGGGGACIFYFGCKQAHVCKHTAHSSESIGGRGEGERAMAPPPILLTTTFLAPLEPNKTFFPNCSPRFAQHIISLIFC